MTSQNATAKKIAALNDALRKHGTGGKIMMTAGIQALGQKAVNEIINKVRAFNSFTKDNDPWGEHGGYPLGGNGVCGHPICERSSQRDMQRDQRSALG